MHRRLRHAQSAAGIAIALIGWSASAAAQVIIKNEWRYSVEPYVWAIGLHGDVGVGPVSSNVDLSSADILRALEFGLMGRAEARKQSYALAFDGIYAKLGGARAFAIRGDTGGLELTQRMTMLNPTGGYTIGDGTWTADLLLGMRYWNLSTSLNVDRTRRPSNERSNTEQWVDAVGGARVNWEPMDKLRVVAGGDGGAGGARDTWQAYGNLNYDAWTRWSLGAGYRALAVNYDRNNFLFDTRLRGFEVVATYRTW